TLDFIQSNQW
ncbi:hypothetical protein BV087_01145B, partial [Haemophilus influenzae]